MHALTMLGKSVMHSREMRGRENAKQGNPYQKGVKYPSICQKH